MFQNNIDFPQLNSDPFINTNDMISSKEEIIESHKFKKRKEKIDNEIFEYILKTPKLKNDLITGEDSFNYTQKQFEDKVKGLNQRLSDYNNKVKDNSELNRHIYLIKFIKNELIIEKILHDKKRAKNKGEKNLYKFDKELFCLIIKQKKLIEQKKNIYGES
jgi:hypothetical protein